MTSKHISAALLTALLGSPLMAQQDRAPQGPKFTEAKLVLSTPDMGVGDIVALQIKGQGVCKNFQINWGDGNQGSSHDFGTPEMPKPAWLNHSYATAGTFNVVISQSGGPTAAEQCGTIAAGSVTVKTFGQATNLKATVVAGNTVAVRVDGAGVCSTPTYISVMNHYRADGLPAMRSQMFAPDAPWPRTANFTVSHVGDFIAYYHPDLPGGSIPKNSCHAAVDGAPNVVVTVKSMGSGVVLKPRPAMKTSPAPTTPPATTPATPPAKPPCKVAGKPGVLDCDK